MPKAAADFRTHAFDLARVDASGKDVGRKVYWRLYAIENLIRVVIHSVLAAQIGPDWWAKAASPDIRGRVKAYKAQYAKAPWYSTPGTHEVYYTFLSDLNKILSANSHLFEPKIPDIDQWVAKIEQVRMPRNIVGHMNWLTSTDRKRIDVFYDDVRRLVDGLIGSGLVLTIPT